MTTIRQQLTRKLQLTVGLLLGAGGLGVYLCARTALLAQFDAALRAKAQAITTLTERKGSLLEIEFSDEHMRGFEAGGRDFFELWQAGEKPVERSRSLRDAHLPLRHGTPEAPLTWNLTLPNGRPGRAVGLKFRPQDSDDQPQEAAPADAILVVACLRHDLDRTLATLQLVLAGSGLLLLMATALVVPRVLRRELTPLQRLAAEAGRIDATSLSARFPTEGLRGELAPITARLNELLARLEDSFERERRFSSDVAHEFRTPVAELRSLAELAIKLPDARATDADHQTLAVALHLEAMLNHLLALARGEQGDLSSQGERVALAPLVQDVCEQFKAKAAARQLTFNRCIPPAASADTDPALLRSILTNLVDNAVEYAPLGGTVNVEASADEGLFTLRVVNTVEHLEERDLPHLFERFWRKDAARSPDGHTGLGLSLARVFAQLLGCELAASFAGPGRLALTLSQGKPGTTRHKTHWP
ncbi:MAG: sensor histidine kinase N-terminal domain-containing protein [Chloroflexi bacterium]|nr:sensor histidine kinase N-terminal domain-containing protein [Chloroflexota bacterium]